MTTLRVRQIKSRLLSLFDQHLDLSAISAVDKDRETKVLTRCLAAFAIFTQTGCSEKEAAEAVWDGSDDNGIDAAFYDPSDSRVVIVQSKWIHAGTGEPEAKDIAAFANGVKDLVEQTTSNFAPRLQTKISEISQAIMTPGTTIHIVVISTGNNLIAKHATANLDRIVDELNGGEDQEPLATKDVLGLDSVYPLLANTSSFDRISIDANLLDWSFKSQPYGAYFGVVDGLQLKEWWSAYGKRLVAKNIRHALGATEVNGQIRHTAITDPDNFWYFNNGITLIAEEALKAPIAAASRSSGNFQFKGASIVNGAQTVSTLGRIDNDDSLGRVRVPIRVILLKAAPEGFGGEVTRTNNLQNRVEARDFVAQDSEQTRLQSEMVMENVEYQFLRSEDFIPSATSCELIEVTTALACASGDPAHAVAVKTGIGRFFIDLRRAPYKAIFNPQLSGARAFNATLVQRSVDEWIDAKKATATKKSGFSWGVLIHGNRILSAVVFKRLGKDVLSQPIVDFKRTHPTLDIAGKCEATYVRMVEILEESYPGKFLAVLFKSPAMSKDVFDRAGQDTPPQEAIAAQVAQPTSTELLATSEPA